MLDVLTDFSHDLSKTHAMNLVDPLILIKTGLYSEQIFTHPVDSWISLSKKKNPCQSTPLLRNSHWAL
jgi:hypothetical protein